MSAFSASYFILFVMDGKIEQRVCSKNHVKLSKSATPEMLCEAVGENSLIRTLVLNSIHVSRPTECQLKMMNVWGDQAPAKQQMLKKFGNSSMKTIIRESMSSQTPLVTVMEVTRRS
jgi:hypothetical protein